MSKSKSRRASAVLGIDFRKDSLVVVELKKSGDSYVVSAIGRKDMSVGYLEPSAPGGAAYVGQRLRSLLREIGATAKTVIVALPDNAYSTRTIELPPMPESEMRVAVEGELRHQKILSDTGGGFDFCAVGSNREESAKDIVVMAAQDIALWQFQDLLKEAGIRAEAYVPYHVAAMRSAIAPPITEPTLVLSIAANSSEMMIVDDSDVLMYRRIDVRGSDLIVHAASLDEETDLAEAAHGLHEAEAPIALRLAQEGKSEGIDPVIGSRLTTELNRSLVYFVRQNPGVQAVRRAMVVVSDPVLQEFEEMLARDLEMEIVKERSPLSQIRDNSASSRNGEINEAHAVAIGLGLQRFGHAEAVVHPFEIAPTVRVIDRVTKISRSLTPALVAAAVFVVLGLSLAYIFSSTAKRLEATNRRMEAEYEALKDKYIPLADEAQTEMQALGELVLHGIPFPPIMDQISESLHDDLALTGVTFDVGGVILLEGVAESEAAIVATLNRLMVSGGFHGTYVNRFEQRLTNEISFNISTLYDLENPARVALATEGPVTDLEGALD